MNETENSEIACRRADLAYFEKRLKQAATCEDRTRILGWIAVTSAWIAGYEHHRDHSNKKDKVTP